MKFIEEVLETRIRPSIHCDGGDVNLIDFDEETGIVDLELQGACAGCHFSSQTLHENISRALQFFVPEVKGVRDLNQAESNVVSEDPKAPPPEAIPSPDAIDADVFEKMMKAAAANAKDDVPLRKSNPDFVDAEEFLGLKQDKS